MLEDWYAESWLLGAFQIAAIFSYSDPPFVTRGEGGVRGRGAGSDVAMVDESSARSDGGRASDRAFEEPFNPAASSVEASGRPHPLAPVTVTTAAAAAVVERFNDS